MAAVTDHVRAAGGLVWRPAAGEDSGSDDFEVLVVHRPRYDDWSLPKGKADGDEGDEACAIREVEEETGLRCVIHGDLGSDSYVDRHGRPKVVRWFLMRPAEGSERHIAVSDDEIPEVDEVRWMPADSAIVLLTYEHDRALVAGFTPPATDSEQRK